MFDFGFLQEPAFALCFKRFGFCCVLPSSPPTPPLPSPTPGLYPYPPPPWSHYVAQTVLKLLYRPGVSVSWVLGLKMFPAFSADFLIQQWIFVSSSYLPCFTFFSCLKTFFFFFSFVYVCVCVCERVYTGACGSQKRASNSPELELEAVVGWEQNWVLCKSSMAS